VEEKWRLVGGLCVTHIVFHMAGFSVEHFPAFLKPGCVSSIARLARLLFAVVLRNRSEEVRPLIAIYCTGSEIGIYRGIVTVQV
jgi:hypothetical protein